MKMIISVTLICTTLSVIPAEAKQICGWYAIAACTRSQADARDFAGKGWGAVINTDDFSGFRRGYFCVVSGPQSKASARRDMQVAMADGVAPDIYIKRACADENLIGD